MERERETLLYSKPFLNVFFNGSVVEFDGVNMPRVLNVGTHTRTLKEVH